VLQSSCLGRGRISRRSTSLYNREESDEVEEGYRLYSPTFYLDQLECRGPSVKLLALLPIFPPAVTSLLGASQ
jgi:hypothetical protein